MLLPELDRLPYTVQNLPYGVIKTSAQRDARCAIAIGEHALDLAAYAKTGSLASLESGHNYRYEDVFAEVRRPK